MFSRCRNILSLLLVACLACSVQFVSAQTKAARDTVAVRLPDDAPAVISPEDSIFYIYGDEMDRPFGDVEGTVTPVITEEDSAIVAKTVRKIRTKRDWTTWSPDPKRAMWLAIVFPGGGQIYNRKYWKLPIFYGGFVGCAYAMRWNNQMFSDYSQAYLDIMDDDPTTQSYNQFLHFGNQITEANKSRYQQVFKSRKDRFRRWRDMSFFCILGVYGLSIVDAYVDASLSHFDISDDLSLSIEPGFVTNSSRGQLMYGNTGVGVNCSLNF